MSYEGTEEEQHLESVEEIGAAEERSEEQDSEEEAVEEGADEQDSDGEVVEEESSWVAYEKACWDMHLDVRGPYKALYIKCLITPFKRGLYVKGHNYDIQNKDHRKRIRHMYVCTYVGTKTSNIDHMPTRFLQVCMYSNQEKTYLLDLCMYIQICT